MRGVIIGVVGYGVCIGGINMPYQHALSIQVAVPAILATVFKYVIVALAAGFYVSGKLSVGHWAKHNFCRLGEFGIIQPSAGVALKCAVITGAVTISEIVA